MDQETPLAPVSSLSFEEALAELEALTSDMAAGNVTLKQSVEGYARGMALLKRCREELNQARATIEAVQNDTTP